MTSVLSRWWGYAEADPTVVGVLVAVIAALAVTHVVARAIRGRRSAARGRKSARSRG